MPDTVSQPGLIPRALDGVGRLVLGILEFVGGLYWLLHELVGWVWRSTVRHQFRFGRTAFISQMVRVGVRSISIVVLVSGSIGFILALQTAPSLQQFGQVDKVANLVGVAVFRELGPLIAAIVLTGFAGASIAAEIGTMVVGEEIEALESMGLNPVRFLVVPRVIASAISLVLLSVIADLSAVFAGGAIGILQLGIPYEVYKDNTIQQLTSADFLTGLFKAGIFGTILGLIACRNGLRVSGGAAGVGKATTDTVVQTVVTVIFADLFFTALFFTLGLG
ncbi:MAG: ABC transporter permease [Phycisphaerales bacterium]|nr:ABC transporter permease [Phycisphaerales bacterium]